MIDLLTITLTCCFWLLFLGRAAMLMRRGVKVFVLARGKRLREKLVELALVPLLVLWTVQILLTALGRPLVNLPVFWSLPTLQWAGFTLCLIGLIIFFAALISFGGAWRVGIDRQNSGRLVTGGIFAYSRNPIFLFMDIYFCGIFFIYPTIFFLVFFICFAAGIHFQILNEERFLSSRFGREYDEYRGRVGRYI